MTADDLFRELLRRRLPAECVDGRIVLINFSGGSGSYTHIVRLRKGGFSLFRLNDDNEVAWLGSEDEVVKWLKAESDDYR